LGTFNRSQFERLKAFARAQVQDIDGRILHLSAEQARIGNIAFAFDKATVTGYVGGDTYLGKLLYVYEVMGGDPFFDLKVRQKSQAVFLIRGNESRPSTQMSDGRIVGTEGLADGLSSELVHQLRGWMEDSLAYKRDNIERKIRRALDYFEQLQEEINLLTTVKSGVDTLGSVENLISEIDQLLQSDRYRAVGDDKGQDPEGTMAYAEYSAYLPGPARPNVDAFSRGGSGEYLTPKEEKV